MEGRTDLILQDSSDNCQGRTTVTVVDWHLKDRVRCWSNQKLLHHSQHAKNSSIY